MVGKLAEALAKAQSVMSGARKDASNPFFKSHYATLSSVFECIREPFSSNGLSVSQTMEVTESGRTVLVTLLMHVSGEQLESRMMLPDLKKPQEMGSALTYYRRYSLMSIAGIPAEDDDGNAANKGTILQEKNDQKPIGDQKAKILELSLTEHPDVLERVNAYLQNNKLTLADIPVSVANSIQQEIRK